MMRAAAALAALGAASALLIGERSMPSAGAGAGGFSAPPAYAVDGDHIVDDSHRDSKPGSPWVPAWSDNPASPVASRLPGQWRADLGRRVVKAADARDAMARCRSFISMGDFTWCRDAMPAELNSLYRYQYRGVHEYNMSNDGIAVASPLPADSLFGLSFGIEETDSWSELMSGLYFVKTALYDCYYSGMRGPVVNDWHRDRSRSRPCTERHCYTVEYENPRVCLDDSSKVQGLFTDRQNRSFQPLRAALEGRGRLSTFLKMDVEGSEWAALEWLLAHDDEMSKIRTLDMEVHFNMYPYVAAADANRSSGVRFTEERPLRRETLARNVEIMERLARRFAVTGSTIEHALQKQIESYAEAGAGTPGLWTEPANIVTESGLNLDQWCISFINRELL